MHERRKRNEEYKLLEINHDLKVYCNITAKHLLTSNKSDLPRFTEDPNPSGAIEIAAIFSSSVAIIVPRLDEVTSDMLPMSEPK